MVGNVWPLTTVQTCKIHLIRNTFRLASKRDWDALKRHVKPIYTAVNAAAARAALDELAEDWGKRYSAILRLWESVWEEFIPFLDYDVEIRRVICSTNAIESLNARYRRAIRARGHFPTEQAALKCLYLVTRSLDPAGTGQARWTIRWKQALNAFAVTFSDGSRPPRPTRGTAGNTFSEIVPLMTEVHSIRHDRVGRVMLPLSDRHDRTSVSRVGRARRRSPVSLLSPVY